VADLAHEAAALLEKVRTDRPLVHNITNHVVMNLTANALLATGASPVMAHAIEEVEDMASIASALVLNIGTLSPRWVEAMLLAGRKATTRGIPVVLDPVGAGATPYRTRTSLAILDEVRVTVLRGNASEVRACAGMAGTTRGVDSSSTVSEAEQAARDIAASRSLTAAVTGPEDVVTDGRTTLVVRNGHPLLGSVTGMGCTATALIGAFAACGTDPVLSTASALAFFGLAGERAAEEARGPGSFQVALMDSLSAISPAVLSRKARIEAG
jgi:hydroxyethylthiazole kinase